MEDAKDHLDNCNNSKEIAAYKKKLAEKKSVTEKIKLKAVLKAFLTTKYYHSVAVIDLAFGYHYGLPGRQQHPK